MKRLILIVLTLFVMTAAPAFAECSECIPVVVQPAITQTIHEEEPKVTFCGHHPKVCAAGRKMKAFGKTAWVKTKHFCQETLPVVQWVGAAVPMLLWALL